MRFSQATLRVTLDQITHLCCASSRQRLVRFREGYTCQCLDSPSENEIEKAVTHRDLTERGEYVPSRADAASA